jgi:hypothetical protein
MKATSGPTSWHTRTKQGHKVPRSSTSVTQPLRRRSRRKPPNFPSSSPSMASPALSAIKRNPPEHPLAVSNKDLGLLSQAKSQALRHISPVAETVYRCLGSKISMARTNQVRTLPTNTINTAPASTTNTLLFSKISLHQVFTINILRTSRASSLMVHESTILLASQIHTRRALHHTHRIHRRPTPTRSSHPCLRSVTGPCHQRNPHIGTTPLEVGFRATISALTADQERQTSQILYLHLEAQETPRCQVGCLGALQVLIHQKDLLLSQA